MKNLQDSILFEGLVTRQEMCDGQKCVVPDCGGKPREVRAVESPSREGEISLSTVPIAIRGLITEGKIKIYLCDTCNTLMWDGMIARQWNEVHYFYRVRYIEEGALKEYSKGLPEKLDKELLKFREKIRKEREG